tara:strand:+ start:4307 stop:5533 length:1227 start_codon:yes stop_codon:yes gene_type:complete
MKQNVKLKLVDTAKETAVSTGKQQRVKLQKGCTLVQRPNSPFWHLNIAVKGEKPVRCSTGKTAFEDAKTFAFGKLAEIKHKQKGGYAVHKTTFEKAADEFVKDCKQQVDTGNMKATTFAFYVQTTRNYIKPYFVTEKKMSIDTVTNKTLLDFQKWRLANPKFTKPSTATLNKEEGVLCRLLNFAQDKGYIKEVPTLKKTKIKSTRFPHFTKKEFKQLLRKLNSFIDASPNGSIRQTRSNMYSAITILAKTGMRPHELLPDTEKQAKGLRWSDVEFGTDKKTKKKFVKLTVRQTASKTDKARTVYADKIAYWHFLRLKEKCSDRWSAITKVFDSDFRRSFRTFLTWANMKTNADGENYCMYSLRHSYATWKIEEGTPIEQLATVMGNSPQIIHKHYSHAMASNFKENFI